MAVSFTVPPNETDLHVEGRIRNVSLDESESPAVEVYSPWRFTEIVPAGAGVLLIDGIEEGATYEVQLRCRRGSLVSPYTASTEYTVGDFGDTILPYSLGMKINADADGATNAGEICLHGYTGGQADFERDGYIAWNGSVITVPRDAGDGLTIAAGGIGARLAFIVFDTAKPGTPRFTANSQSRHVALAYRSGSTWYYDNNATATSFTPVANRDVALGWVEMNGDNVVQGGLFGQPVPLEIAAFPAATQGAQLGIDVLDEAGEILADIDLRNDLLVTDALAAINANPTFQIPRQHTNGEIVPASWYGWGSGSWVQYLDGTTRDDMYFPSTSGIRVVNAAFRPEPGSSYEVAVLARKLTSGDPTTLRVLIFELDSELASGQRTLITGSHSGTGADPSSLFATATRIITLASAQALTGTYAVYAFTYTPTSTAKWAALSLDPQDNSLATNGMSVEWAIVRERATRNTGVLADLDEVDTPEITDNAVTNVTSASTDGATSVDVTPTWTEVARSSAFSGLSGSKMVILGSFRISTSVSIVSMRLRRYNATAGTYTTLITPAGGAWGNNFPFMFMHTDTLPTSASFRYVLELQLTSGSADASYRQLVVLETKR
jgi:hypothetical protein